MSSLGPSCSWGNACSWPCLFPSFLGNEELSYSLLAPWSGQPLASSLLLWFPISNGSPCGERISGETCFLVLSQDTHYSTALPIFFLHVDTPTLSLQLAIELEEAWGSSIDHVPEELPRTSQDSPFVGPIGLVQLRILLELCEQILTCKKAWSSLYGWMTSQEETKVSKEWGLLCKYIDVVSMVKCYQ